MYKRQVYIPSSSVLAFVTDFQFTLHTISLFIFKRNDIEKYRHFGSRDEGEVKMLPV